jgi:low affinity Fe/Cu permease
VLAKFTDLPHKVEAEIRSLDGARRRIVGLERQIRKLTSSNTASQLNQAAIERAVNVAVERERAAWQRKFERGRAWLRRMIAIMGSRGGR